MAGPCASKQRTVNDLDTTWSRESRELENNKDQKDIVAKNLTIVGLVKKRTASTDQKVKDDLTSQIEAIKHDIDQLIPKVQPWASSINDLKLQLDDAQKALNDCLEEHKENVEGHTTGGGQSR